MNNNRLHHREVVEDNGGIAFPFPGSTANVLGGGVEYMARNQGLNIGVTPGAVVGAVVGGALANRSVKKQNEEKMKIEYAQRMKNMPRINGNYYNQVQSVAKNLDVVFTPMSAIYVVKNGKQDFTLDTIETGEMNDSMKVAWKTKDSNYFKDLMMSKMLTEMQVAEQSFTKSFIKKQMDMQGKITKQASDTSYVDEMDDISILEECVKIASFYDGSPVKDSLLNAVASDVEKECVACEISFKLERPLTKYAGVITGIKSSLGLNSGIDDLRTVKKQLQDPRYTMRNINVGFFPDRVVFSLGNKLVSTLPLTSMNDEGYAHFQSQNGKYFKNFFAENVKSMMKSAKENTVYIEKSASFEEVVSGAEFLTHQDTHPVALYLTLSARFGMEWITYEIGAIEDIIKSEYGIEEISDSNLNKIYAILTVNQSMIPFENAYSFEKITLSLAGKQVDFLSKEKDVVEIADIIFALDVMDRVTPFDDIYDNFTGQVMNYIADIITDKEIYVYSPANIVSSPLEPAFAEMLNEMIVKSIKVKMTADSMDEELSDSISTRCDSIADNALGILKAIRRYMQGGEIPGDASRDSLVDAIMDKRGIVSDRNIIKRQVTTNLALDDVLYLYENTLQSQMGMYNISRPE